MKWLNSLLDCLTFSFILAVIYFAVSGSQEILLASVKVSIPIGFIAFFIYCIIVKLDKRDGK